MINMGNLQFREQSPLWAMYLSHFQVSPANEEKKFFTTDTFSAHFAALHDLSVSQYLQQCYILSTCDKLLCHWFSAKEITQQTKSTETNKTKIIHQSFSFVKKVSLLSKISVTLWYPVLLPVKTYRPTWTWGKSKFCCLNSQCRVISSKMALASLGIYLFWNKARGAGGLKSLSTDCDVTTIWDLKSIAMNWYFQLH